MLADLRRSYQHGQRGQPCSKLAVTANPAHARCPTCTRISNSGARVSQPEGPS